MKSETNGMESGGELDALVRRARQGDAEALGELYRQLRPRVFGLCRHLLGSREAAEDAASEVFLKAQRAMKTYDSALPFPRWLLSIASHYCIDVLRRRRLEQRLFHPGEIESEEPAAQRLSPLAEVMQAERRDHVRAAVEALPERYRLPLVLRYYSELSYEQIAGTLGLNRNHVATLIFRAKQELRRSLQRQAVSLAREPVQ
ncbi:MAG TPA: RNA polymerase sigma factor [Candidatus Xenobia bacterium]|nr:RNA polymerase sigma factor [Candidatus Xenobia bacterium]